MYSLFFRLAVSVRNTTTVTWTSMHVLYLQYVSAFYSLCIYSLSVYDNGQFYFGFQNYVKPTESGVFILLEIYRVLGPTKIVLSN